jgi:hypothetical protein
MFCRKAYTYPFIFIIVAYIYYYLRIGRALLIFNDGIYFLDKLSKLRLKDFNADYSIIYRFYLGILL